MVNHGTHGIHGKANKGVAMQDFGKGKHQYPKWCLLEFTLPLAASPKRQRGITLPLANASGSYSSCLPNGMMVKEKHDYIPWHRRVRRVLTHLTGRRRLG